MDNKDFSFKDNNIIIPGGAGDLGQEVTVNFLKRGANVTVIGTNKDKWDNLYNSVPVYKDQLHWIQADLATENGIEKVKKYMLEQDHIDILINFSGINLRNPILKTTFYEWDQVLNVNLKAPYFLSQYAARKMLQQGRGKIIHIGSLSSTLGLPNMGPYGASKGAIAQVTKSMAVEWAPVIQVNAVAPGYFRTSMTNELFEDEVRKSEILNRIPSKRTGNPDDLVGAILFLCSDAANYITGQMLCVDGGWTIN
ncbi:hypothetical protein CVD28_27335 [Bacillus sp. M6-12]|uniref:SDR family NAD(P)-dependent oxidoreductase n=1 Tax=Bacillus sp. M6-12 TaxID=2054166 RepID=UPI000C75A8D5|nr:SDR family oxidoreductase [Bacillus sp. M6-12]PLS14588.1 hypothetical protein CVD28_27335 [Bacillus sp. M6-12]